MQEMCKLYRDYFNIFLFTDIYFFIFLSQDVKNQWMVVCDSFLFFWVALGQA